MKNLTQDLIKAFRRIDKYGKSEISVDTYIRYICIDRNSMKRLNRNLAFAELMSRLAPSKEMNEWYIAGLLNDVCDMRFPGMSNSPGVIKAILSRANVNRGIVYAIENFRKIKDPRRWTPMIAALNFVDAHIEPGGDILTTNECCSKYGEKENCNSCMYARYYFSQTGMHTEAEEIILKLKSELEKKDEEGRSRKEEIHGTEQRRLEKGSQEANAVCAT